MEDHIVTSFWNLTYLLQSFVIRLDSDRCEICFRYIHGLLRDVFALGELQYLGFEIQADRVHYSVPAQRELAEIQSLYDQRSTTFEYPKSALFV